MILFSDTGGGHRATAKALSGALRSIKSDICLDIFDPLVADGPPVIRRLAGLYPMIIRRSRPAWGAIYHATNNRPAFRAMRLGLGAGVRQRVIHRIRIFQPDLVISVHPLLNHVASAAIRAAGPKRPLVTVVTDLIDFHLGWACPKSDLIVVPTDAAKRVVIGHGVNGDSVKLLGLPVDLRFRPPAPGEQAALRRRFGIQENVPTLLLTAGGDGTGGLIRQVKALAESSNPWQLLVVCGNNHRIREQLARKQFSTPTKIFGFVDNMPELMRASDLVIGKAGPGAIAEALSTGLPMIITTYLPGQETANVRFVTESGFGVYIPKPELLLKTVEGFFNGDRKELDNMAKIASIIARPYAALDVARICLEML